MNRTVMSESQRIRNEYMEELAKKDMEEFFASRDKIPAAVSVRAECGDSSVEKETSEQRQSRRFE